jgi:hypothetical protein
MGDDVSEGNGTTLNVANEFKVHLDLSRKAHGSIRELLRVVDQFCDIPPCKDFDNRDCSNYVEVGRACATYAVFSPLTL